MGKTAAVDGSASDQQAKGVESKRNYRLWVVAGVAGVLFIGVVGGMGQYGLSHHPSSLNAISDTTLSGMRYGGFIGGGVVFVASVVAYFDVDKKLKKFLSRQSPEVDANNDKANSDPSKVDVIVHTATVPLTNAGKNTAHSEDITMAQSLQKLPSSARMWRIATPQELRLANEHGYRHIPLVAGCIKDDSSITFLFIFDRDDPILYCLRDIPIDEYSSDPQSCLRSTSTLPIRDYSFKPCSEESCKEFSKSLEDDQGCMVVESASQHRDGNKVNLYKIIRKREGVIEELDNLELEEARGMMYHLALKNEYYVIKNETEKKLSFHSP